MIGARRESCIQLKAIVAVEELGIVDHWGTSAKTDAIADVDEILHVKVGVRLGQLNEISLDYSWTDDQHLIQVDVLTDYNSWNQNETIRFAHMNSKTKIKFKEQPKKNKNRIELIIESRSDASKTSNTPACSSQSAADCCRRVVWVFLFCCCDAHFSQQQQSQ